MTHLAVELLWDRHVGEAAVGGDFVAEGSQLSRCRLGQG